MYLKKFVTDEMLQKIQTNLYNVWKEGKSVNTTSTETRQVRLSLKLFEEKFQAIQSFRVSCLLMGVPNMGYSTEVHGQHR